ncbi:MAG: hypothetical protein O2966_02825 [Proteobacteria bacterium]|nr:hypothetical protein [Pseudomonadota bacterium]
MKKPLLPLILPWPSKHSTAHYSRKRLYSKLCYLSPIAFETKKVA